MIAVSLIKRGLLVVALAGALAVVSAGSAYAEALAPWWGMTMGSRPTSLRPEALKSDVQELTVSATGGEFAVLKFEGEELVHRFLPWNAKAEAVQTALEELYGSHRVEVTGGPGDAGGTTPYVITFPGQSVQAPLVSGEYPGFFGGKDLTGGRAEATLTEVSQGPSPNETAQVIYVMAENRGDATTTGFTTVTDTLPKGLEALEIEGVAAGEGPIERGPVSCSLKTLSCTYGGGSFINGGTGKLTPDGLLPYQPLEVRIAVRVLPGAQSGEQNSASVSGGGAARPASASHAIEVNGAERFGFEEVQVLPENVGGSIDTQAGSHPFQLTTILTLNTKPAPKKQPRTVALPKEIVSQLPAGLVGNPTPIAQCTDKQFSETTSPQEVSYFWNKCPPQSAIGVAVVPVTIRVSEAERELYQPVRQPIYNMQPNPGEPARFGFKVSGLVPVFLDTSVRTGSDYGVTVTSRDIPEQSWLMGVRLTFWGTPGDPRHDSARGWGCLEDLGACPASTIPYPQPFLALPTSCQGAFETIVSGESWETPTGPGLVAQPFAYRSPEGISGCNHLPFEPSVSVAPDVPSGSSSTGLTVGVHVPQTATLNAKGLAESTLKDTTVALPAGVGLNPAGANGLEACSESEIGFTGVEPGSGLDLFTAGLPEPFCPDASKIGTVKVKTPLLPNALEGAVYLAAQNANPFSSLVAMYIVAKDPVSGVLVKLPGVVRLDEQTGRIVATFENTPDLPFEDLEMHFFGGERAPLGTPALCGSYTTEAAFTPWSGNEAAHPTSTFQVTSGPNGRACADPLPFAPSLTAGTTSIQAGGFSPFTMTMSREDGNQDLRSVQLHMPPGLLGTLSSVKLCGEEQANAGTCGAESLIGHTTVSVGLGGDPYSVTGGEVFITGPYHGAPFGLSIVNPAKAGPFDLGKVIVRAKIEVNQSTSALTITTDPSGPYAIPHIIDGIPLQIKHINVSIDRPGFTFNPTNCSPLQVTGTLSSQEGASGAVAVPFQATNCAVLAFKPKLTATTSGKTSRSGGASLSVKLTYPAGPYDANIARVKVELPKKLPSRLTTLQKACTAAVFEANPANCPPASIVGHATASTPVLPVPLSGPAYFVSHGGEAFPSLIVVLQGYGVTVHLVGSTSISKQGVTSSTFKTVPDVPVGTFELTLPEGPYSALAANGNLCKAKNLSMPTEFTGQNGALIKTSTKIQATNCPKAKKATRRKTRHKKSKQHKNSHNKTRARKKG